ncbi:MAG: hypothetical protein HY901_16225 [Deltaproteobacteria bacterium]|nr:hypothetical protein [Deltaproteobacteria bacterium]
MRIASSPSVFLVVVVLGSSACREAVQPAASERPEAKVEMPVLVKGPDAGVQVGEEVRIRGKAVNAKLSAAVLADGWLVYCLERQGWPDELVNREITVRGRLERTDDFQARVGPRGEVSQGTAGGDWVLRQCALER